MKRSAHCEAGGHKQCHGLRLGRIAGHASQTLVPCECGCHTGAGTREIDRLRAENEWLRGEVADILPRMDADALTISALVRERNELRAEIERLHLELQRHQVTGDYEMGQRHMEATLMPEIERLRTSDEAWKVQLERESARNEGLRQEVERLLIDNAELSDECDQWERKQQQSWQEIADLRDELARANNA